MSVTTKRTVGIQRLTVMAMLCAVAYLSVFLCSPIKVQFLSFDIKDCILSIGGFLYGPIFGVLSVILVSFLEMVTFSQTGPIGLLMNIVSSAAFLLPSALYYKKDRSLKGAIIGLSLSVVITSGVMLLWNWVITPFYMNVPRTVVASMLLPLILPFNALKSAVNAVLSVLLYKNVVTALRKARLIPPSAREATVSSHRWSWLFAVLFVILTTILLWWSGII